MQYFVVVYKVKRWWGWKSQAFFTYAVDRGSLAAGFATPNYRDVRISALPNN